jgi:hypothetical protein
VHSPSDAGGVDEAPRSTTKLDQLVDRIDRGARLLVDDHALLAGKPVEKAGLADVRLPEQCDATRAARRGGSLGWGLGKRVEDGVEQVATPPSVKCRDRVRLAEAERPEASRLGLSGGPIDLVGGEDDRLTRPS